MKNYEIFGLIVGLQCFTYKISCFLSICLLRELPALHANDVYLFINLCDHLLSTLGPFSHHLIGT